MAEKRKDSKNRNLFTGESERKDGTYMYRYTDTFGKRHSIYAPTLNELRRKEKELQKDIDDGVSIKNANITVTELLDIYLKSNFAWKQSTRERKECYVGKIKRHKISKMKIGQVKMSHVKEFLIDLHKQGVKRGTLLSYKSVLCSAFKIAYQDDWIRKNPAEFGIDFITNDSKETEIIPEHLEKSFLELVQNTKKISHYHDIFVVLLDTGLRASELTGLTLNDINLKEKTININHQLGIVNTKKEGVRYFIETPKTENGIRTIPLTDRACLALSNLIRRRNTLFKVEPVIDGYSKFLLLSNRGCGVITPKALSYNIEKSIQLYNRTYKDKMPELTPHSFRHTFCTRMIEKGMNVYALQHIMGHSDIRTTLGIYTHYSVQRAVQDMQDLIDA